MTKLLINKGRVLLYRVYDIGEEINLEKAQNILQNEATARAKFKLKKTHEQAVVVSTPPLALSLGQYSYLENGEHFSAEISAKIWHFGTVSIMFEFQIPEGSSIDELKIYSSKIQSRDELDEFARSKARELAGQIKDSMAKITDWPGYEDYILYFVEKFNEDIEDATKILEREDIAALIIDEESNKLSNQIREKIYSTKLQYYKNDLTIIDWNSAFIIEPTGAMETCDVIEFSLNQVLEMRFYDELLDNKLKALYSAVELREHNILSSKYSDLALEASQRYIEIAEIIESVENSIKVIGDIYLATVFKTASTKFRFSDWQHTIDNKLSNMAKLSELLLDNVNSKRSHLLEIIIIILISIEVVPFLWNVFKIFLN